MVILGPPFGHHDLQQARTQPTGTLETTLHGYIPSTTEKNKPCPRLKLQTRSFLAVQHAIRTAHAHRGALAPFFSTLSTLSIGCRTRATRLPSPFLPSPTQFPPSAPHTRMHTCPNRVSNPYPSPPSITQSSNQSSIIINHQLPTIHQIHPSPHAHSTHLAPNLTHQSTYHHTQSPNPTHPPQKPTRPSQPKPQHAAAQSHRSEPCGMLAL
jgi:hypothetical protein